MAIPLIIGSVLIIVGIVTLALAIGTAGSNGPAIAGGILLILIGWSFIAVIIYHATHHCCSG